jgi:hypothetical protein
MMYLIDNFFLRLEFHQCGAVILAQFGQGGAHMAEDFRVERIAVQTGRTAAEEFFGSENLLMDFESGFEADRGVVVRGHFTKRFESHAESVPGGTGVFMYAISKN